MFKAWAAKFENSISKSRSFIRKKLDGSEDIPKKCKIHREDGSPFEVNINAKTTSGTIIKELSSKLAVNHDWVIVLELEALSMVRRLEDDELFLQVYLYWKRSEQPEDFRFCIMRDPMKFGYFRKAKNVFPPKMFAINEEDFQNLGQKSDVARQTQLQYMILRSDNVPIVFEQLQIRKFGDDVWETKFVALKNKVLFSSPSLTTDTSKMENVIDLKDCDIYTFNEPVTVLESRNENCICLTQLKVREGDHYTYPYWVVIACGSLEAKLCWLTAFRMAKFGSFIRSEYYENHERRYKAHRLPSMSERTRIAIEFSDKVTVQDSREEEVGPDIFVTLSNVPESSKLGHHLEMPFLHPETTPRGANQLMRLHPEVNGACLIYGNRDKKFPYMLLYNRVCEPGILSEIHGAPIWKFRAKITNSDILVKESKTDPNRNGKDFHFYYKIDTENNDPPVFQDLLQLVEYHHLNDDLKTRLTHYIDKNGKLLTLDLKQT